MAMYIDKLRAIASASDDLNGKVIDLLKGALLREYVFTSERANDGGKMLELLVEVAGRDIPTVNSIIAEKRELMHQLGNLKDLILWLETF